MDAETTKKRDAIPAGSSPQVTATMDVRSERREPTASVMTYASKLPPDHPGLKLDRPQPRILRKGPIVVTIAILATTVGIALLVALSPRAEPAKTGVPVLPEASAKNVQIAESVQNAPGNEADIHAPPQLGPPVREIARSRTPGGAASNDLSVEGEQQTAREETAKLLGSAILVDVDVPPNADPTPIQSRGGVPVEVATPASQSGAAAAAAADTSSQGAKRDFLSRDGQDSSTYLAQPVLAPRSPYEIKAGTILPATLLTGINSDLPGQIVGQIRENVYDTVTGEHLLVPQGSRLIATYDSAVAFGQERVLVCWNRLIRPDGVSVVLECMPGVDLAGYAGFADEVDHHWWRIISGVALGTLLSATAQRSQGDVSGFHPTLPQLWASNAGATVNQAGQEITRKNLAIQPTIKVRPGYTVNVLVTKDMVITPYKR
jgi:type IV secretory pathway VirB10-like protein